MSAPDLPAVPKARLRRVAMASSIGTTIEFYDFFIYGTAAALVFPTIFFSDMSPAVATLASFATFAVAFFARPVGAILFGHFGDRIGRKRTLVWTLLIMGAATVAIGLLPGSETGVFGLFPNGIGTLAPVLLVAMRFLQGFAVGGEWAGATLLTAEYAPKGKRGLYAMFPQLGPAFAFFLSSGTFLLFTLVAGDTKNADSAFMTIGWRIPFLMSALLVLVGLWVRLSVEETPVFTAVRKRAMAEIHRTKLPFLDAIRFQWKEILIAGGALASLFSLFYMGTAFLTNYATKNLGFERSTVLTMGMIAAVFFGVSIAASAVYSDRIGRRKVIMASCALAVVWALVLFPILDTRSLPMYALGLIGTLVIFGIAYGPAGAALPELFHERYRYTGAGLGYNLAGIFGGAVPPLLAARLVADGRVLWVGVMLAALSAVSVVCCYLMVETKDHDIVESSPADADEARPGEDLAAV
ncbi:Inner membrane metabolite transport protein yhjE [Tsukamurella paurometabola]|uniref:Inner membrane metabolite transport protein yhjE n=2 Tax=Tsukamurella paurometabola TaxID=2061 RepID=A0A3P8KRH4_TSUPA|nr:Inner membrane metabolite transport protein yhjE [Tsukamurella paurometabola]